MEVITVTWKLAAKVWWSWFWRAMLWTLPISLVVGFIFGVSLAASGIPIAPYALHLQSIGLFIGIYFSVYAMKKILTKSFKGYRIAIVSVADSTNPANEQDTETSLQG